MSERRWGHSYHNHKEDYQNKTDNWWSDQWDSASWNGKKDQRLYERGYPAQEKGYWRRESYKSDQGGEESHDPVHNNKKTAAASHYERKRGWWESDDSDQGHWQCTEDSSQRGHKRKRQPYSEPWSRWQKQGSKKINQDPRPERPKEETILRWLGWFLRKDGFTWGMRKFARLKDAVDFMKSQKQPFGISTPDDLKKIIEDYDTKGRFHVRENQQDVCKVERQYRDQ